MDIEFKVGDKVRLEGTITDAWKTHVYVQLKGDSETVCNVRMDAMAHAKLIQPKPRYDWSNIPPEYDWMDTDRGGTVYAYKNRPVSDEELGYWYEEKFPAKHIRPGSFTADWRDSLKQRPEAVDHITPCKGTNCGSMNGVHSPECEAEHIAAITGAVVESKVLDLSKPIQFKNYPDRKIKAVYGPTSINTYMVEEEKGVINMYMGEVLENTPEPKKTVMQEVNLHEYANGSRFFSSGYVSCAALISKARITHTDGEGWSIKEVK